MKNLVKFSKAWMLALLCVLFLGVGIKAEAAPGTVTGLKQTGYNTTAVRVDWTKVSGASEYKVEWCENSNFSGTVKSDESTSNPYIITGLAAGKSYYVRVSAIDSAGNAGTASSKIETVTAPNGKVTNLKQKKLENKKIQFSWSKVTGANIYEVGYQKTTATKATFKTSTQTSYNLSASANSRYYIRIYPARKSSTGYIARGTGYQQKEMATTPSKITKVKMFDSGKKKPTDNQVRFTWNRSNAADGYEYEIYGSGKKPVVKKTVKNQNYTTIAVVEKSNRLKNNQFMKIRVRGYVKIGNAKKYGKWSDYTYFAKHPTKLKAGFVVKNSVSGGIKFSWKKVSGANNYSLYISRSPYSIGQKVKTTNSTSCVIKKYNGSQFSDGRYYYTVIANKKVKGKTYKSDQTWYGYYGFTITTNYY